MQNELYHHGILGMKWGIRRYQNKDGSLTTEGKRHYKNLQTATASASETANQLSRSNNAIAEARVHGKSNSMDLSKMSDKDLQAAVNRMNLERQYKKLSTEDAVKGQQYVGDILAISGGILAATSSALAIALTIKQLKGE